MASLRRRAVEYRLSRGARATQYVRSGDADIAYQVLGDGPRDVVVVLDWASHLEALVEQPFIAEWFSSLARFARVLWFGTRGVGMSGPLSEGSPIESWMDDLVTVMDAAGFERASLVAHGLGAQVALMAAATHPERVDSLVVVNGYTRFARADDYPAGLPEHMHEAVSRRARTAVGHRCPCPRTRPVGRSPARCRGLVGTGRALRCDAACRPRPARDDSRARRSRPSSPSSRSRRSSSTAVTTCSSASVMGATWPSRSPGRATSSATARTTGRCRTRISSRRSRSS